MRNTPETPEFRRPARPGKTNPVTLKKIPARARQRMSAAGMDFSEKKRGGTFIQKNQDILHSSSLEKGIEVLPLEEALKRHPRCRSLLWQLVDPDNDEFTREVAEAKPNGYFLRAQRGSRSLFPLQSCLFLGGQNLVQNVHNLVIAEAGSTLEVISGCATAAHVKSGLHNGVSEIYVRRGAKLTFTMIHNWAEEVIVRPRTGITVEEGGTFVSNYICLKPVRDVQMYPSARLARGATGIFNSIVFAHPGARLDIGSRIILAGKNSRGEIVSRAVSGGGSILARGHLRGEVPGVRGHLECRGLIIPRKGTIHAVPELEALVNDLDMSH